MATKQLDIKPIEAQSASVRMFEAMREVVSGRSWRKLFLPLVLRFLTGSLAKLNENSENILLVLHHGKAEEVVKFRGLFAFAIRDFENVFEPMPGQLAQHYAKSREILSAVDEFLSQVWEIDPQQPYSQQMKQAREMEAEDEAYDQEDEAMFHFIQEVKEDSESMEDPIVKRILDDTK